MDAGMQPTAPKPKVLLVHGFFSCRAAWEPLQRELQGEVDSVAPDLLGYGDARARVARRYSLEAIVDDLETILEREQPTHILGHSMGGIVSLALAARHPGRFGRIGIVGLPVFHSRPDGLAYLHKRGLAYRAMLHSVPLSHIGCVAVHRTRHLWRPFGFAVVPFQPAGVLEGAFAHSLAGHSGINSIVFANLADQVADVVTDPVVMLHGGRDKAAPPERAQALAERRGWQFHLHPRHGHQAVVEHPRYVANWMKRHVLGARQESCAPS